MRDIEFVPGPSGESDGSEELDGGGRRRIPPWLIVAVLAVIAAFVAVVILNRSGAPTAAPAATASASRSLPAPSPTGPLLSYTYRPPLPRGVGQPFRLGFTGHVFDVAVSAQGVWALTDHGLVLLRPDGTRVTEGMQDTQLPPIYTSGSARLLVDRSAGLIWVVVSGQRRGRVIAYQLVYRNRVVDVATPPIKGAAALDGRLYITSGHRVLAVAQDGLISGVATLPDALGAVTADPSRHRLLVLDYAQRTRLWPIARTATSRMQVGRSVRVHVYPTALVVADGRIWVGGFDNGYGTVFRLDPRSLQLVPGSIDRNRLATGAVPAAGGASVLWVRDAQGMQLHCLDARTGRDLQDWSIDGPVASRPGLAVVASRAGLVPLQMSECRG